MCVVGSEHARLDCFRMEVARTEYFARQAATRRDSRRGRLVDAMSRDGAPVSNPPPRRHVLAQVSLLSCREGLRAAVRLLSLLDPDRPDAPSLAGTSEAAVERRAIARDFQDAEQAYDDLITNISHEVKTSLTVIRGHAQMMARAVRRGDAIDRDALLATLKTIDSSALRISDDLDNRIGGDSTNPG